jgi:hypothetical protein
VRIVGGPEGAGAAIARQFGELIKYLGPLPNESMAEEASTWSCFVHPIFCWPRGCSTKLAVALGWEIPVITTVPGMRGYQWREGTLPVAETPRSLTDLAIQLQDPKTAQSARAAVQRIGRSAPSKEEIAFQVKAALERLSSARETPL